MTQPEMELTLDRLIDYLDSRVGEPHRCPYLPDREARMSGFVAGALAPELYHLLMDRGFRRSGPLVYRPVCAGCRQCVPLRVPAADFKRSRSQARVWRKNRDLTITVGPPQCTPQKWEIYVRYLRAQHDGTMSEDFEAFHSFLYESNVESLEFVYRLGRRIVAVSIADLCRYSLSSVYALFEPSEHRRSLGTFSALREIEYCREAGLPYYYLGHYVRDCARMNYKAHFRPHELLGDYRHWQPAEAWGQPPSPDGLGLRAGPNRSIT